MSADARADITLALYAVMLAAAWLALLLSAPGGIGA